MNDIHDTDLISLSYSKIALSLQYIHIWTSKKWKMIHNWCLTKCTVNLIY